jgi:hypothetical protein
MSANQDIPKIPVPRGWKQHVRSAVLHVISLANQEVGLLGEEMRIKDARMAQIDPHRRPHYPPVERMAILQLRAVRGWSLEQTAGPLYMTAPTISSWLRRFPSRLDQTVALCASAWDKYLLGWGRHPNTSCVIATAFSTATRSGGGPAGKASASLDMARWRQAWTAVRDDSRLPREATPLASGDAPACRVMRNRGV